MMHLTRLQNNPDLDPGSFIITNQKVSDELTIMELRSQRLKKSK